MIEFEYDIYLYKHTVSADEEDGQKKAISNIQFAMATEKSKINAYSKASGTRTWRVLIM